MGQLLQFLTTRRGQLISAHASEVDILRTMECCPPAAYQYPPDDDTGGGDTAAADDDDAEVAGDVDAQVEAAVEERATGTDEEKGEDPKEADLYPQSALPQQPWIDVSSVSRCIDYSDFLDMLCRVVFSDWWTYSAASSSQELQLEGESSDQLSPPLVDSSENMATEELLYNRLLTFSLTFNVDELASTKT